MAELRRKAGDDQPEVGTASPFTEPQKNKDNNSIKIIMIKKMEEMGKRERKRPRATKNTKERESSLCMNLELYKPRKIVKGATVCRLPDDGMAALSKNPNKDMAYQPGRGLSGEHPDYRRLKAAANIQAFESLVVHIPSSLRSLMEYRVSIGYFRTTTSRQAGPFV
jgi:hypothetical protein